MRKKNIIADMEEYVTLLGVRIDPAGYMTVLSATEIYYKMSKEIKVKGVSIVVFSDVDRLSTGEGLGLESKTIRLRYLLEADSTVGHTRYFYITSFRNTRCKRGLDRNSGGILVMV